MQSFLEKRTDEGIRAIAICPSTMTSSSPARRSRRSASSRSSPSSDSPDTSSSSGTSCSSAGARAFWCRDAARRPTAWSATRSASRPSIRSAWICSSSAFCPKSAASGRTSISTCPAATQRERAIQYVYQRYGELGAAMTANVITYRGRSAAREAGKALGFDAETLNRLTKLVSAWEWKDKNETLDRNFHDAGFDIQHRRIAKYVELCQRMQDLPRHLGQHSGGMVICGGQLNAVVPIEPASMPGRTVIQWDKEDCADMKIIKVDLLGLGMMAVLKDCLELVPAHYDEPLDLAQLPQNDPPTYRALQQADTVGMFQVESRAQMAALPRNHPTCFYDLVVQVAIIRPGPIVGNMMNPYMKRRRGKEKVSYYHPLLEPVLKRTLGIPLFQEQLIRMAMIVANFTGGEAEELRRAVGMRRSMARMKELDGKLRRGMTANGIAPKVQDEIIQSISSFALYGFPESHAASFALIAYASAYLKCNYLAAFTAALLNNQPMGFYSPATIVKDAQRHGLRVKPVDVQHSAWPCTLESWSLRQIRTPLRSAPWPLLCARIAP